MSTWKVILQPDGNVIVEHHALVGWNDLVLGGADDINEARRLRDSYVAKRKEEQANDQSQKELF